MPWLMQFRNTIKAYNMSPLKRMYVNELPKLSQTQWMLMTCGNAIVLWWIMQRIRLLSGVLQITIQRRYINLAVPIPFTLEPGGDVVNGQLESRAISLGDILAGEQYESRTLSPGRRCRPEPFAGRCFRRSVWALHCTDVDCKLCQKKKKKRKKKCFVESFHLQRFMPQLYLPFRQSCSTTWAAGEPPQRALSQEQS